MWEEGVRIYGTPGVHNNFPNQRQVWENECITFPKKYQGQPRYGTH